MFIQIGKDYYLNMNFIKEIYFDVQSNQWIAEATLKDEALGCYDRYVIDNAYLHLLEERLK